VRTKCLNLFSLDKEIDINSVDFSNQKKKYSENNKVQEKKLIDSDDLIRNCNINLKHPDIQSGKQNEQTFINHNLININSNNSHTYRIRNKKKDYKEKDEMKINFIKNSNTLSNHENIMKFNKFNLKKYYQNKNRSKNRLVKINENSESENDSVKKMHTKNNKDLLSNNNSDYALERMDSNCINGNLFGNNNSSNLEKENLKNDLKKMENKESLGTNTKLLSSKEDNISKENFVSKNRKETLSNNSENRDIIRLKNLNTNDTTSLKSSEGSISKTNSFQLDYNSVKLKTNFF
jgi:hypothetical protein